MKRMKRNSALAALLAAVGGFAMMSTASAVPCGDFATYGGIKVGATDLGISSATCQNGTGSNDSASAMNAGNGFFGIDEWTQLNKVPDSPVNTSLWSFDPVIVNGQTVSGQFTLADGVWSVFSSLVAVLKDGGATLNKDVKWSAYLLPNGVLGPYDWSYDNRKGVSHITLYGVRGGTVTVPEPAGLAALVVALGGIALVVRRRKAAARG